MKLTLAFALLLLWIAPLGDVWFGRSDQTLPDFQWDDGNHKLRVRSLIIADNGDPVDVALRRAGPDGAASTTPPSAVEPTSNLGLLYWQAFGTNGDFDVPGAPGRAAQIYARQVGWPTATSRGGSLHLATTGLNEIGPRDRVVLESDGIVSLPGVPTVYSGKVYWPDTCAYLKVRLPNQTIGWLPVLCGASALK